MPLAQSSLNSCLRDIWRSRCLFAVHSKQLMWSSHAEALAEATYMFQQPGMGLPPEQYAKHILLFSMTAAHEVPVPWPASASHVSPCTC